MVFEGFSMQKSSKMPVENDLEKKWHTNDNKCRFVSILGAILEPESVKNKEKNVSEKKYKKSQKNGPETKITFCLGGMRVPHSASLSLPK